MLLTKTVEMILLRLHLVRTHRNEQINRQSERERESETETETDRDRETATDKGRDIKEKDCR